MQYNTKIGSCFGHKKKCSQVGEHTYKEKKRVHLGEEYQNEEEKVGQTKRRRQAKDLWCLDQK